MKLITKSLVLILLFLTISGCKKYEPEYDYNELTFGREGRDFIFPQRLKLFSGERNVNCNIPPDAVSRIHAISYYTFYLEDKEDVPGYYINFWGNDLNLIRSTAEEFSKDVNIVLPYPSSVVKPAWSSYQPYLIRTDGTSPVSQAVLDTALWEAVPDFYWDEEGKNIYFTTRELNCVFVIARKK